MDSSGKNPNVRSGKKPSIVNSFKGVGKEENEEEEEVKQCLLPSAVKGGKGGRRKKSSRRRVQWNDRDGNKLAEVLEFLPSDPSDSEDEMDACICTIM